MAWSNEKKIEMCMIMVNRNCKYREVMVEAIWHLGMVLIEIQDEDLPENVEEYILDSIHKLSGALTA